MEKHEAKEHTAAPPTVQNVYDNPVFFEGYKQHGAIVRGVDVSKRMLEVARERLASEEGQQPDIYGGGGHHPGRLSFVECALEHYTDEPDTYDVIVAGLVLHYVRDLEPLLCNIHRWLKPGGVFAFSTEHPICTSSLGFHPRYVLDDTATSEQKEKTATPQYKYFIYDNYHQEGLRTDTWIVDGVERYHRTMASWINGLVEAGLIIDRLLEPRPTPEALAAHPELKSFDKRRVIFMCMRAHKSA